MPAADRISPGMSTRGAAGSREVGTNKMPPTIATTAIGMFTMKIAPHQKCSSNQPPLIGPTATPTPTMAAHSPIALARRYRVGEDVGDQSQGGREDHRRAHAHGSPRRDELLRRIRLRRNGRT